MSLTTEKRHTLDTIFNEKGYTDYKWPWTFIAPCAGSGFPSTFVPITIRKWIAMHF
jgi:hypothetical protein